MSNELIINLCEYPTYSVVANNKVVFIYSLQGLQIESVVHQCVSELEVEFVKCIVKPLNISTAYSFPLETINSGYINANISDINKILSCCKANGIPQLSVYSYLDYYDFIHKDNCILFDFTVDDKLLGIVFKESKIIDGFIGSSNEIFEYMKRRYIGEENSPNTYDCINARNYSMFSYYESFIPNVDKKLTKYSYIINPLLYTLITQPKIILNDEQQTHTAETIDNSNADFFDSMELHEEENMYGVNSVDKKEEKRPKINKSLPDKKLTSKNKATYTKKIEEDRREVVDIPDSFDSVFLVCNIILGFILGFCIVCSTQLSADLAGFSDAIYNTKSQLNVINCENDMINRVLASQENEKSKLCSIYDNIIAIPIDGVIGNIDISGNKISLEVYTRNETSVDTYCDSIKNVFNVSSIDQQGSVSIGNDVMQKIRIIGDL